MIAVIGSSPVWARPTTYASGDSTSPPDSASTFGTFCAAAATRYSSSIKHWEIWNEPNLKQFWGGVGASFGTDPIHFAAMQSAAYDAIKGVDSTATVISGGLGSAETTGGYTAPIDFIDTMLDQGIGSKLDGIGVHPYTYSVLPDSTFYDHIWRQMYLTTPSMKSVMEDHSVGNLKFWLTEFGAPTNGPGPAGTVANNYGISIYPPLPAWVDEQVQAQQFTTAITLARARPDLFANFMAWTLLDSEAPGTLTDREKHFGILEMDGTPKDASAAFTAAINATGGPA